MEISDLRLFLRPKRSNTRETFTFCNFRSNKINSGRKPAKRMKVETEDEKKAKLVDEETFFANILV